MKVSKLDLEPKVAEPDKDEAYHTKKAEAG